MSAPPPPPSVGTTPRRWGWLVATGLALAAIIGAAVAFFAMRRDRAPELAKTMPHDLDVYAEIPDIEAFFAELARARHLDAEELAVEPLVREGALELAATLELPPMPTVGLVEATTAAAYGIRMESGAPEHLIVVRLDEASAAEAMLGHERLVPEEGADVGRRYRLVGAPSPQRASKPGPHAPAATPERLLRSLAGAPRIEQALWLPDASLFALGSEGLLDALEEVVTDGSSTLEENAAFQSTRALLPRHFAAFAFFDERALRRLRRTREAAEYLFHRPGPFAASLSFVEAGSRLTLHLPLSGKAMPEPRLAGEPAKLTLHERLPIETLGYLAFSTHVDGEGDELEDAFVESYEERAPDVESALESAIDRAERDLGLDLDDLVDGAGDEGLVGVLTTPGYRAAAPPKFPTELGVVYLQHLGDTDQARRMVREVRRDRLDEERYEIEERRGEGFDAEPADATHDPFVKVRFEDGNLFAALGPAGLVERCHDAFTNGNGTLAQDDAHADAIAALGADLRVYGWIDTGRILDEVLKADPTLPKELRDYGLAPEAFTTTGSERFTTAFGLAWRAEEEVWRLRFELFNALPPLPAIAYYRMRHQRRSSRPKEAINAVRAVASAAEAAYEQSARVRLVPPDEDDEGEDDEEAGSYVTERSLCGSAKPVPSEVPRRGSVTPLAAEGSHYRTGDEETGWKCLGYSSSAPNHFQISYVAGGPYKGPPRGGPDPGPNGFEVSAEGDLDGDGETSLFTLTGTIDEEGRLELASTVFEDEADE